MQDSFDLGPLPALTPPMKPSNYVAMSDTQLVKTALAFAKSGNAFKIEELVDVFLYGEDEERGAERVDMVHDALLQNDFVDMVRDTMESEDLIFWCQTNSKHIFEKCPKTFEYWFNSGDSLGAYLADAFQDLPLEDIERFYDTGGATRPLRLLHHALRKDPELWPLLSPAWVGASHSSLRQKATDLGWDDKYLPQMLGIQWRLGEQPSWLSQVRYPYSVLLADFVLAEQRGEKPVLRAPTYDGPIRSGREGWSVVCPAATRPEDIALGQLLLQSVGSKVSLFAHPDTKELVTPEQREQLRVMLNTYKALGIVEELVQELCNGKMPGFHQEQAMTIALPELGAS